MKALVAACVLVGGCAIGSRVVANDSLDRVIKGKRRGEPCDPMPTVLALAIEALVIGGIVLARGDDGLSDKGAVAIGLIGSDAVIGTLMMVNACTVFRDD